MGGFVANGGPAPNRATANIINSNPFWPEIDLDDLRQAARLDSSTVDRRLHFAAVDAISSVNRDLRNWRQQQQAAGYDSLAAVPAEIIGDESELVMLYRRAVYCLTEAGVRERYRDYDSTSEGQKKAEQAERPINDIRRDARWAIRDILGRTRCNAELI